MCLWEKETLRTLEEYQDLSSLIVFFAVAGNHNSACISLQLDEEGALLTIGNLLGCNQAWVVKYSTADVWTYLWFSAQGAMQE